MRQIFQNLPWVQPAVPPVIASPYERRGVLQKVKRNQVLKAGGDNPKSFLLVRGLCVYRIASAIKGSSSILSLIPPGRSMCDISAAVESKVDMATRTLKVRATYPNPGENILPGRYTSVEISKREIKDALAIPSEAVIPEMGKDIVYLYKNGVAEPQEITIGIRTESRVQVLQGLNVGDTLITSGVMQLRTGMKVSIDNLTE